MGRIFVTSLHGLQHDGSAQCRVLFGPFQYRDGFISKPSVKGSQNGHVRWRSGTRQTTSESLGARMERTQIFAWNLGPLVRWRLRVASRTPRPSLSPTRTLWEFVDGGWVMQNWRAGVGQQDKSQVHGPRDRAVDEVDH